MSGGSYKYLCFKDASDIFCHEEELQQMADRLGELGYADAARETYEVLLTIRQQHVRLQAMLTRMEPIWKAVEWKDSGDWGLEPLIEAIEKYRGEKKP